MLRGVLSSKNRMTVASGKTREPIIMSPGRRFMLLNSRQATRKPM
jgi:hypothetical protein